MFTGSVSEGKIETSLEPRDRGRDLRVDGNVDEIGT
jgi:hypothetical protein